ncbi:hypothetical protein OK016_23770 [Vibrio chagasii]|nr:hypothetical protein [Vibrio chagasii]
MFIILILFDKLGKDNLSSSASSVGGYFEVEKGQLIVVLLELNAVSESKEL